MTASNPGNPRQLSGLDELLAVRSDDFARAVADPRTVGSWWAFSDAVGWVSPSRRVPGRAHLTVLGRPATAAALLRALIDDHGISSVTLPRDSDAHLPTYRLDPRNDWEWFVTRAAPPTQPGEHAVDWLTQADDEEVRELLATWSPRHDVDPGDPDVRRWAGVRDRSNSSTGTLIAAAAFVEHVPGVPHLASVVTHGEHRGHGLGAAVTGWVTRTLLADGQDWVTLGMYSDNDVARRMYRRLGYANDHHFTSGRLLPR